MKGKVNRIAVFDTTLRDGAQTPGISLNFQDRLLIAKALANIGVDVIEIGFAANDVDFPYMQELAKFIGSRVCSVNKNVPIVCSLARVLREDVLLAYESIKSADPDRRRIHLFIGTSEELMSHSHGKREETILNMISENVDYARYLLGPKGQIEYSSEDSLRTNYNFLVKTIQTAINHGVDVVNVPDTTGFAPPDKYYETITGLKKVVEGIDRIELSAHIHNDSGNAIATTLKGIEAGIRQIEGCALQLGERAGNADWMTLITDLHNSVDYYGIAVEHINSEQFYVLARLISSITGQPIPLNHPVVGRAAFSESSGIHVKGAIRNYRSYFVIPPETVGRKVDIVLGQTSGTNTIAYFLREHGYGEIGNDYDIGQVSAMTFAVKRQSVSIGDSLTETEAKLFAEHYIRGKPFQKRLTLEKFRTLTLSNEKPQTQIAIELDGNKIVAEGIGEGTVDSFMNAVKNALNMHDVELFYWDEKAVYHGKGAPGYELVDEMEFSNEELKIFRDNRFESKGQEAIAKSMIELSYQNKTYHGRGFAKDIIRATYDAIIDAFDAIYRLA